MNRTTPPPDRRPFMVRVAHAWYSWAGLALTVVGSYLAANGQLHVGDGPHLQAAGPEPVGWQPSKAPTSSDGSKINLAPAADPNDPFRPAAPVSPTSAAKDVPPAIKPAPVPSNPDPFVASATEVKTPLNDKVRPVLDAYVHDKAVVPAKGAAPAPPPKITPPPVPILPAPADMAAPKSPTATTKETAPIVIPATVNPGGPGGKFPPIPPPPSPSAPGVVASEPTLPNDLLAQEPEKLPILPRPVGKADEKPADKKETPPKKRKILGTLSQDDEIKLNAAQNAARLGDFNRAASLMADVISRNPDEYDLRAEFAGILISAGDPKGAIRELQQVIKAAPNVAAYRLLLGDAYMVAGQFRTAADVFMSALEMVASDPKLADRIPEVAIRAARAYALANDYIRAAQLVDKHLSGIRPDDPKAPPAMGAMLLDLDRPYDALPYLIEKRKQLLASPEATEEYELRLLEVLASMARGFARVGDRQQALEVIQEMASRAPKQLAIRVTLADILNDLGEYELAGHVYNQVLAVDPANGPALIGIARVYLETFQTANAKRVLDSFVPNPAYQRLYLLTYAGYHQSVGEHTEAKQIYKDMLHRNDNDHEVRFAFGRLYEFTSEWEKAKAEFAKIPPQDKMGRRARFWFGMALLHQRKFAEAAQVAEQFMRDDPNNPEGVTLHVRALAKMGQFDRAVQSGHGYLATNPRDDRAAASVRLAVARALLEANRNLDAAREYEIVLTRPAGRVPEAYYGLARAAEKLGNADRAHQIITTLCGAVAGDFRTRLLLADYYSQDFEDEKVIEIINSFPNFDNNNLALLIRLADAQQRTSRWSGDPTDAFGTIQAILRQSPTNVRGHLAMARSFAVAQNYRKASVQYDQLITIDPEFTIPPRERARILFSDHQYSAARTQYNVLLSPTPEDVIVSQMTYHAQRDARIRQAFGPYLGGQFNGLAVRSELARIAATSPEEEVRQTAHRLICDYDATLAWQEAVRLERDGKELRDYRNYMAVPQYNAVTQFEPTNIEVLFDQGQVYGALKMTRAALTWYQNTL
ncbi:MAG TPA: tetratricopeptide repeat protein, partial [Gemmataceae bacterium]|nr:tetratricopeptide repeat protein [Gemmataceae bacterium]